MANIDAAFEQQILDLAERQRVPDIHHHRQTDYLGRTVKVAEGISHPKTLNGSVGSLKLDCSDNAERNKLVAGEANTSHSFLAGRLLHGESRIKDSGLDRSKR